jgi:hypothetical protein
MSLTLPCSSRRKQIARADSTGSARAFVMANDTTALAHKNSKRPTDACREIDLPIQIQLSRPASVTKRGVGHWRVLRADVEIRISSVIHDMIL